MGQQEYRVNSLGGFYSVPKLTAEMRHASQPLQKFRQFTSIENGMGKGQSEFLFFDKVSNLATQGSTIAETDTIPTSNYAIRQDSLQITEYGIGINFTEKLQHLSMISVSDEIKRVLFDDMSKALDSAAAAQFQTTKYIAVATNTATTIFTTDGVATAVAAANPSDKNHRDIIDRMKTLNIPAFDRENYAAILSVNGMRGIYDFLEPKAENTTMAPLFAGEFGQYYKCRLIEETNVLSNAIGSGSQYGQAMYFGADAVKEGIAVAEEIRIGVPEDVGRKQKMVWYYLGGFKKMWDFATDTETRIIYVTSA